MARAPLRAGDPARIGHYRLTARLGSGGMGVVYLGIGWDGSQVAVKVLRPELADDQEFRSRFRREVSALMRVKGVCTVRVIEADTESAHPFMITEYAEGPSLAEYIDSYGLIGPDMLYGLATGLAEALTVIHAAGIVHRDFKPSNVILTDAGPKVIDFGIAQALDATSLTRTGMMVGSAGFMAPEQITGRPGPPTDIFVWGVTVAYAATGQPPFGTGDTHAVLYRVMHGDPDISGVPDPLRSLVAAALTKDPDQRPTARQLLDQLTGLSMVPMAPSPRVQESPTQTILAKTWQQTGPGPSGPRPAGEASRSNGSLLLEPAQPPGAQPPGAQPPGTPSRGTPPPGATTPATHSGAADDSPGRFSRRTAAIGTAALAAAAVAAAVVFAILPGHTPKEGPAANEGGPGTATPVAPNTLPTYPGQLARGVFQRIDRIVTSGSTMVTTGSQKTGNAVRQQFFVSTDAGQNWQLAPVQLPAGGQPPLGHEAIRIAGGQRGWMAFGDDAIWISQNGQSWTLAGTRGITPRQSSDTINVVTNTPDGFLAAGYETTSAGSQAVTWTSRDGVTWQRLTAAQLGLQEPAGTPSGIDFAVSHGNATVITDRGAGVWLSTDSGAHWTPVTIPVDHGAQNAISGVSFDGAGLIAVRPGRTASGASDGVAYFSQDGRTWQYAGTIAAAGGWSPDVVKGSDYGFVVVGHTRDQYVAYTSTGTGRKWLPTGSLGSTSSGPGFTPAVGPDGSVIAAGSTNSTRTNQQGLLIKADTAGHQQPVSLSSIQGGLVPEETVSSIAVAGNEQVAVGSADGYPAVWRRVSDGPWTLVSSLTQVSAGTDLAELSAVTHGPHGWLAVGPGPLVLTSTDGTTWRPSSGITHDLAGVSAVQAASGPHGYVITGTVAEPGGANSRDVWSSPDLVTWTKARDVNEEGGSGRVLAVAAGPAGFVSAGSHDKLPAVWTSSDGRTWTAVSTPLPAGAAAGVIQQVAVNGSHVVALGQQTTAHGVQPLAERSDDGGKTWQPVPFTAPGPGVSFTALTASGGGFNAAAQFGSSGGTTAAAVWTSANGTSWARSSVSGLTDGGSHAITALAASGSAVKGIDSVQTQASQQFVVRSLPSG
ncbi:MAG TPA: protein kinase [Streptosporangiaceae bacterium]